VSFGGYGAEGNGWGGERGYELARLAQKTMIGGPAAKSVRVNSKQPRDRRKRKEKKEKSVRRGGWGQAENVHIQDPTKHKTGDGQRKDQHQRAKKV